MLMKMPISNNLLEKVVDKQTFIEFVQALAEGRERAQEIEHTHPNLYIMDGALGWKMVIYPVSYPPHSNASWHNQ